MNPLKVLTTPEYLFRPGQILTRLKRSLVKPRHDLEEVRMPWGLRLRIRPLEVIGAGIWYYGIFDLIVAEAITRLLGPAETALDVGANIGQMTSLMTHLVGPGGKVHAFEPHPELFAELSANCTATRATGAEVVLHQVGVSNQSGEAWLATGAAWTGNRGVAKVVTEMREDASSGKIRLATLDEMLPGKEPIGLCKIDVEGHECQVFEGAQGLLRAGRIRDILFEDFNPHPSRTARLLLEHGYSLFLVWSKLTRPVLTPAERANAVPAERESSNYLATREPKRAANRLKAWGWQVLRLG